LGGGFVKLLTNLLNHKATANMDGQTTILSAKLDDGFRTMGNKLYAAVNRIDAGNNEVVKAILTLKT
jgi:hypothetical protein